MSSAFESQDVAAVLRASRQILRIDSDGGSDTGADRRPD